MGGPKGIWTSAVEDEYGCTREITCAEPMCTCESSKCESSKCESTASWTARIMDGTPAATPNATGPPPGPPRVEPALVEATALGWYA